VQEGYIPFIVTVTNSFSSQEVLGLAVEQLIMDMVVQEVNNILGNFLMKDTSNVTTVPAGAGGSDVTGNNGKFGQVTDVTISA
jgi:hypothetical protein